MLAIGDAPGDAPVDLDGVVLFDLFASRNLEALAIEGVIRALLESGSSVFRAGFVTLYALGVDDDPANPLLGYLTSLASGVTYRTALGEVELSGDRYIRQGKAPLPQLCPFVVPTIHQVQASDAYQKPFDRVERLLPCPLLFVCPLSKMLCQITP
jgi:hypothetical protein